MIIAFSGRIGSGKDTAAEIIKKLDPSFEIKKFAAKLKTVASLLTGIPVENFEDQEFKKTFLSEQWTYADFAYGGFGSKPKLRQMTVRGFLQRLGTDAVRDNLHTNAWVNALFADYKPGDNWLITDCRFPNEYDAVKYHGGIVVRMERGELIEDVHASENALDHHKFDYRIDNNGSLDDLSEQVYLLLSVAQSNPNRAGNYSNII
jgi:hypothetical protein